MLKYKAVDITLSKWNDIYLTKSSNLIVLCFPPRDINILIYRFIFLNLTIYFQLVLGFSIFTTHLSELDIFIESNTSEYFPLPIFFSQIYIDPYLT